MYPVMIEDGSDFGYAAAMGDDTEPAPKPVESQPLEYYQPTGTEPLHPALLTLCTIAGLGIGFGVTVFGITALGLTFADHGGSLAMAVYGIVVVLLGIGIFIMGHRWDRGRLLELSQRRRGPRFFMIGLILGCGLTCLLQGLCFTAVGTSLG